MTAIADNDVSGEIGWFRGADPISLSDAAQQIFAGRGGVLASAGAGKLGLFDSLSDDAPQFDRPMSWIIDLSPIAVAVALRPLPRAAAMTWRPNWTPLADLAGSVADVDRALLTAAFAGRA